MADVRPDEDYYESHYQPKGSGQYFALKRIAAPFGCCEELL
jgi:hypothetical protein